MLGIRVGCDSEAGAVAVPSDPIPQRLRLLTLDRPVAWPPQGVLNVEEASTERATRDTDAVDRADTANEENEIGAYKADFSSIYVQPDPRAYFRTLGGLDYQIPHQALPVITAVLTAASGSAAPRTVLDICSSYGINGALLRFDVELDELTARYTDPGRARLAAAEIIRSDAEYFAQRPRSPQVPVYGLDVSQPAIDYGRRVGLLTRGWAENLESDEPSPDLAAQLGSVGMVISTGGVGYVGVPTFERVLARVDEPEDLWLAVFVLRGIGYDGITAALSAYGLVTEQIPDATFRQRRFADHDEYDAAVQAAQARGLDTAGQEDDGWYHADCYLTRPARAAAQTPLGELLRDVQLPG